MSAKVKRNIHRKRVPCPVDPSHTIYEDQVDRHIPICPTTKRRQEERNREYYRQNINAGGHGELEGDRARPEKPSLEWAVLVARRVLRVYSSPLFLGSSLLDRDLSKRELGTGLEESLVSYRIKSGGAKHLPQLASLVGHVRDAMVDGDGIDGDGDGKKGQEEGDESEKEENDGGGAVTLLELGAGRGMFGLVAAGMINGDTVAESSLSSSSSSSKRRRKVDLVMVERAGATKSKADTVLRGVNHGTMERKKYKRKGEGANEGRIGTAIPNEVTHVADAAHGVESSRYLNLSGVSWSRIVGDLAHVDLPSAIRHREATKNESVGENESGSSRKESADGGPIFVLAKHLCGVGTDLALKSMSSLASSSSDRPRPRLRGCLLATCCHGVCNWGD